MVKNLKFNKNDDGSISYTFVEEVVKEGVVSREEFDNKYDKLVEENEEVEKQMTELNVKRQEYADQLNSYEIVYDLEKETETPEVAE